MGREATCHCKWGAEEGDCKVLLEGSELVVRLGLRRRVPLSAMAGVAAHGSKLVFNVGHDHVELGLGPEVAQRWAKAIASPPPTLASKLGISPATKLAVIGEVPSEELKTAIAEGSAGSGKEADLTVICVRSQCDLHLALRQCFARKTFSGPLWIVYPKGPSSEVRESDVRELLRAQGFIDTKVASVSAKLTALRFVSRPRH
jgi:hypothetical protein